MKILFICENYLPHYGGAEVVFKNLAENYVKKGHQVTLLTHQLEGTRKEEEINGVKVIRVPSFNSRYVFSFTAIPQAIKLAKKHDIIQTTSFNGAPPAWLASKLTRKPVVITVHEVWRKKWQKVTGFSWWKSQLHEFLEWAIYSLPYNHYICVSNSTKKDLLRVKIKENKVSAIHNGLDYQFWNDEDLDEEKVKGIREEIREKFGLQDKFVYFSWGRSGSSKGFEYLIKAVPKISQQIPNSVFVLMLGSVEKYPQKYQQLMGMIEEVEKNHPGRIRLIPPIPHQELRYYLKSFDCAVIPSIAEGFGFNVVEANQMGIPLVGSDAGSIPEVISGRYLLFRNKDSLNLAEKVVLVQEGKWLETPLKRFNWGESVERYLGVYEKLILGK